MSCGNMYSGTSRILEEGKKKTKEQNPQDLFLFSHKKNLPSNQYVVQSVRENLCSRKNDQKTTRNTRLEQNIF